mgnify:FL=1
MYIINFINSCNMVYWDDDTCTFVQQSLRNNGEIDTDVSTMSVRDSLYLYFVK